MKAGDRVAVIFETPEFGRSIYFGHIAEGQSRGLPTVREIRLARGQSAVPVRLDCNPSEVDWVNAACVKPCPTIVDEIGFYGRGDVHAVRSEDRA